MWSLFKKNGTRIDLNDYTLSGGGKLGESYVHRTNPYLNGKEKEAVARFIDLSNFCTGSPLFDLGVLMVHTCWLQEEQERELYHIGLDTSKAFWKAFVPAYFGSDASLEEVEAQLRPYALLRVLVVERIIGAPHLEIRPELHKMIGL
jgi:hypothetical protein